MYVGEFSKKGDDEVVGGATSKAPTYNIKKHMNYWGTTMRMTPDK